MNNFLKMQSKNILLISLRGDLGGGPKHLDSIYQNLKGEFNLFVASPKEKPFGLTWANELNDKFLLLPHRKFSIQSFFKLISFISKNKIDIIHAHGKGAGIYARFVKIFFPAIKVIYTWHGLHIDKYNSLGKFIYIMIEKFLSIFTDLFINVSESERNICIKNNIYKIEKSIVINNGIEDKFNSVDKNLSRENLNLPLDKFIIINISRFDKKNNLQTFIDIVSLFISNHNILFLLCGDGEEKSNILNEIEKKKLSNIILKGFITNPTEYLTASDLYLSTSINEGLPYSLIEASMCGLPIIASDVVGNNDIVINSLNGFLYDLKDLNKVVELIMRIKEDKVLYRKLSLDSRRIFLEKFQERKMIDELKKVYQEITK